MLALKFVLFLKCFIIFVNLSINIFLQPLFLKGVEKPFIAQGQSTHLQTLRGC
jgi:hypothetical protein